jgi:hydroxymethylpyrimidine/phosphomethylpyrimidine kinase
MPSPIPVLTISGHDPTGGAGIQADIEAISRQGCFPLSLITCLTAQDTHEVKKIFPQAPNALLEQLEVLLDDIPVKAVKVGLLGSAEIAKAIAFALHKYPPEVLVLDPVLASGGGKPLADEALIQTLREELLPLTTVLTPNCLEAKRLSGKQQMSACAEILLEAGCKAVLITGGDEPTPLIYNTLYHAQGRKTFVWERVPHGAHGSGCTLASALAALLAQGLPLEEAAQKAQAYTWNAIKHGVKLGHGQPLPCRR